MRATNVVAGCATAVGLLAGSVACASDDSDTLDNTSSATVVNAPETTRSSAAGDPNTTPGIEPQATVAGAPDTAPPVETLSPRAIGESTGTLPGLSPQLAPAGPGRVEFTTFDRAFSIELPDSMSVAEGTDYVVVESPDAKTRMVFFTSDAFANVESELYEDQLVDPRSELQRERLEGLPVEPLDAWLSELDNERLITMQLGSDILVGAAPRDFYSFVASLPTIEAATSAPALAIAGLDDSVVQVVGDTQYRIYELDDDDNAWYVLVTDPSINAEPSSPTTPVDNLLRTLEEFYK